MINNTFTKQAISFKNVNKFYNAVLTKDERHIICFLEPQDQFAEIYVLDIITMKVRKSKINAPSSYAVTLCVTQNINKQLSTSGFIRKCWTLKEFTGMRFPPVYLIKIVESYVNFEIIHYLNTTGYWIINVDDILNNIHN